MSAIVLLALFGLTSLDAQISYRCFCDDTYPEGVVGFEIIAFGNGPGETWTVDNVINLYSSVNPLINISDGTVLQPDPMNPSQYVLTGFAFNGVMPFVTIIDDSGMINDVNMITCMIPEGEIIGDDNVCLGTTAALEFDVSASNIIPNSTVWDAPGAASAVPNGPDNLRLDVSYDMPGSYLVSVTTRSSTNCEITDDFIVNVFDAADGIQISGPDYICIDNATDVMYMATNPDGYGLIWSGSGAGGSTIFDPFLGNPMTGSGSSVSVDFPSSGTYVLEISNADPSGCLIDGVEYLVEVVDQIDTVQIIGETYVCESNTESYTIANAAGYSNVIWSVSPPADATMTPPGGMANSVELQYNVIGDYQLTVTGDTPDGCMFSSTIDITVPDNNIPSLACNNTVNVSLNNDCILELLPDMILEGEINDNNDAYDIVIEDVQTGMILPDNMVTQDQLGHTFKVTVIEKCGGNSCWGTLVVEDKSVTPLDQFCSTAPIVTTCYAFGNNPMQPLGFPDFPSDATWEYNSISDNWLVSGFDNCSDALLSYEDEVLSADVCDDPQLIRRVWTAVDINNGEFTTCEVIIQLTLTDHNSIIWPPDYDSTLDMDPSGSADTDGILPSLDPCNFTAHDSLFCGDFWYADASGNPSPDCTGAPVSNGFACPNLQLIGYTDRVLPVCGSSKKILRQWTVWDACDLTDIMHTQIITLMDTVPPVCQPPLETQVTTDVHECGADIVVEPPVVTGECDDFTYTIRYKLKDQFGYQPALFSTEGVVYDANLDRYIIQDVEFNTDSIWVQYIVRDACGNKANDCFAEFELIDDEQPVPACDFNNFVTLNQYGEAWVGPATFDDNSWDNCGVYTRVIRRMDAVCECAEPKFDFLHALGEYEGHYYYLSKEKMHAGKAFGIAAALDAYIVRIDGSEENQWVRSQVDQYTDEPVYIGLSGVTASSLQWQSGNSTYENWQANEPQLSVPLKLNERVYSAMDENGEWLAEGRNQLDHYYVLELEEKCSWSQKVSFCCEDVGEETMVALKLIDWHGNHNQCMVNVRVMDFIPPYITCPDDVTANCDESFDPTDLSGFGDATAIDDCGTVTIEESSDIIPRNCGEYYIRRTFTASDVAGNEGTCVQEITLENENPFTYDEIEWPQDTTLYDVACKLEGIDASITGEPSWDESEFPCSNITYTYDDLVFYIAEGVCQKLVRTWTVVDWCQPNRLWEYSQVIKLVNTVPPTIDPSSCVNFTYSNSEVLGNCLVRINDLTAELSDDDLNCGHDPLWRYSIDLYNDGSIDIEAFGNNASGDYPYGTHRIEWHVTDDCDNTASCDKLFTILDNIPPTPYCHGEIVIPISHTDGIEIWASDLNLGSYDDCPSNPVYFSFEENQLDQNMSFDCSVLDSASNEVSIEIDLWVWDNLNAFLANKSRCTVTLTIQDNTGVCAEQNSPVTNISGMIYTEDIEMVHGVDMHLTSSAMYRDMMATEGLFAFNDISMYDDYMVEAFKNDDFLNGVSTLDLIMIQRHILGLEKLDSPYKIIAADVDNSSSISVRDLIDLRKLILGIYDELPENLSWRFVEEDFKFIDPADPFPYSEHIELQNLDAKVSNADFIAVKIGDVNRSASTKAQSETEIINRSANPYYTIELQTQRTDKGNTRVQLIAGERVEMNGIQFELAFDDNHTEMIAAVPMAISFGNEHINWEALEEGRFRLSWNDMDGIALDAGAVLMEILLSGNGDVDIRQKDKSVLSPELYAINDNGIDVRDLRIIKQSGEAFDFEVKQNVPNPFKDETLIEFQLDRRSQVRFTVTDQTGRLLYSKTNVRDAGPNSILLNSQDINATGLLYYQISTESNTATRKMIVIQ